MGTIIPINTPTFTNTPVPPPINTPTFTKTPVNTPTFTKTPVNTPTFTNTPVPVNQPPVVDAGANQTITWPATAPLNGTVSDDGRPNGQLTITWQKVTGPGNVTFTPANQPQSTATFSTPGNYVLILIANDGTLNNHALVNITVNGSAPAAPSGLQATAISPTEIQLTWTDNATNETGFVVSDGTVQFSTGANVTLFVNSGLPPNSYRCYYVYARNDYGKSAPTDWACTTSLPLQIDELNMRVQYQYRDNSVQQWQDVPFQITIKDAAGIQTLYQTDHWIFPTPAAEGNYSTAALLLADPDLVYGRTYQIFMRGAMHLTRRVSVTLIEGMNLDLTDPAINPNGPLLACDINQDNQINQADIDVLAISIQAGGPLPPTPDPNSSLYRSDIGGDRFIDITDFSMCRINLGKVGD